MKIHTYSKLKIYENMRNSLKKSRTNKIKE